MENARQSPTGLSEVGLVRNIAADCVGVRKPNFSEFFIYFSLLILTCLTISAAAQSDTNRNVLSIADFHKLVAENRCAVRSFRLEGVVCATLPKRNMVVLKDATGAVMLELSALNASIKPGDSAGIEGEHCLLVRTSYGIRVGSPLLIDNDGTHSRMKRSARVFLESGMNPIRVEWFNGPSESVLNLDYEGPDIPLTKVPEDILWHGSNRNENEQPAQYLKGLRYAAYEGDGWRVLPDFSNLKPMKQGVATNINVSYRTRETSCGLCFEGGMEISKPGFYTLHFESDDGAKLFLGNSNLTCKRINGKPPTNYFAENLDQALNGARNHSWAEISGEVTFVSRNQESVEMELLTGSRRVPVTVLEGATQFPTNLLHQWISAEGICVFSSGPEDKQFAGVFVPGAAHVKLSKGGNTTANAKVDRLTTVAQVRRLDAEQASSGIPVTIRGVVIYATPTALVLQDSTGGVFLGTRSGTWADQPEVGECWEIEGSTSAGDFSPVVIADQATYRGRMPLPEPIRPTHDQLMNGNLDAEYVELRGVLTSTNSAELALLTAEGKITVLGDRDRPLPQLPSPIRATKSLVGSVIRMRGCLAPLVDLQTHQVVPGKLFLHPAVVEVEDPPPSDPFRLPTRKASDLMWFDARASALQRTKLAGMVIYSLPGEYYVLDGRTGFRVLTKTPVKLDPGDLVEAVGFPKVGGASPLLQEAQIRKTGFLPMPIPVPVSSEKLLDRKRDSTLVQIEAILLNDALHQGERVLELESGSRMFVARLRTPSPGGLPPGSRLLITGVYASADEEHVGPDRSPFELLVNRPSDIVLLEKPSWWTARRTMTIAVILAGALGASSIWVALLRRKVEQKTAQLKKEIEERQIAQQHRAVEQERIRVAQDLHDELGAGLTEVSMLGALANTAAIPQEGKERYLGQLTQKARSLVTSLDEIVWAVNPQYDSASSLASYFSLFAQPFLNLAGIACRLEVSNDIPDLPMDSKLRHGVFRAFKEALNNVIRHSGATEVRLGFNVVDGLLKISIIDNGRGIEVVERTPGKDGVEGLRQRMHHLGGDCKISSQAGQGTKVELCLPLKRS